MTYYVFKKEECPAPRCKGSGWFLPGSAVCTACKGEGWVYVEVELEEAMREVLRVDMDLFGDYPE